MTVRSIYLSSNSLSILIWWLNLCDLVVVFTVSLVRTACSWPALHAALNSVKEGLACACWDQSVRVAALRGDQQCQSPTAL